MRLRHALGAAGLVLLLAGPAAAAPTIIHQPPLDAKEGQPVPVNAIVTDPVSPVMQVRLFYRATGTVGFQLEIMNGTGYNYAGQIPGSAVQPSGVDYYIEASDQMGMIESSPAVNPVLAPYHLVATRQVSAPALELLSPDNGATVSAEEAVIVVAIHSEQSRPDLSSLSVLLDEKDVTSQARVSETLISFVPPEPLSPGLHGVRVSLRNQDGATGESPTWSFTVQAPGVSGQPAVNTERAAAPAFRLTGGLALESQYADLLQTPADTSYLSRPEGFLNRLNLNVMGKVQDFDILGSAYLTSEETPGRQPVDRVRLEMFNRSVNLALGDVFPIFSDYTVNGLWVRGGRLMLTSGQPGEAFSQLQVTGGMTRYPIDSRPDYSGTFEQWIWASRWLYDFLPGCGMALNYSTLNDYGNSIQQIPDGSQPADNHVISGEAHLRFQLASQLATSLYSEYAMSYFDQESNLTSVSLGSAYRAGMRWEWDSRSNLQAEYRHTGSTFVDMANPWLIGDWDGFSGNTLIFFLAQDLAFSAHVDAWRDNLDGQKNQTYVDAAGTSVTAGTTRTLYCSGSLNYRIPPYIPAISLSYSVNRQEDDFQPTPVINNQTSVLNLGTGVQIPLGQDQMAVNTSYSLIQYHDLAQVKLSADFFSSTWMSSLLYTLGRQWVFNAGFGLTQNQNDSSAVLTSATPGKQTTHYILTSLHADWRFLPGKWEAGAGWENFAGKDDVSLVDNNLSTLSLSGTCYVKANQSAVLTLAHITYDDRLVDSKSYREFVVNARYNINF